MAVRRAPNGATLYWIQPGFGKVEVTVMEASYGTVAATQDLQINARQQNNMAVDQYTNTLANEQGHVNEGRPYSVPVKPLEIVVSDPVIDDWGEVTGGVQSTRAFVPALPDLKMPTNIVPSQVNKS